MTIPNHDHEIEKKVHPENFDTHEYEDGDKNYDDECINCEELPTVHPTDLCGPCCFGEAETYGGNW